MVQSAWGPTPCAAVGLTALRPTACRRVAPAPDLAIDTVAAFSGASRWPQALTPRSGDVPARPVQVILQNHGRGRGVQLCLALAPVAFPARQPALGFAAAEPLVLQHDRPVDEAAEFACECLRVGRLIGRAPVEPARQPDDDRAEPLVLGDQLAQRGRHGLDGRLVAIHGEGGERPGDQAGPVAHGQTDAARADVDRSDTLRGGHARW